MQRWLRANGGGLALVLVGVAVSGWTNAYVGVPIIVLGFLMVLGQHFRPVSPKEVVRELDESCRVVVEMRRNDEVLELPVFGKGFVGESMFGRISVAEARQAFL
jgi:hypothetical protein